ncbi:MAG: YhdP family protein [Rhodanobacteraceae bacterium]
MRLAWRQHLRRARFALTALIAVVLIGAAVAMGLVQLLLPLATHYPDFVANQLSARLHRPVKFAGISSQWQPSGPLLTVHGLTLGPDKPGGHSITLPHAAVKFDFGAWLRPAHRWITLRVSGAELRVVHTSAGWQVAGFGNAEGQPHASLQSLPVDLDLRNLRVDIVDTVTDHSWHLSAPRLRVVNVGDSVRFGGRIKQQHTQQAMTVIGRMDASSRSGELYLATNKLDLVAATRNVDLHGYTVHGGQANIELWGRWRDGKFDSATLRYALRGVDVTGADGRRVSMPLFAGVFSAQRARNGWNIAWRGPGKPRADIDKAGGLIAHLRGHPGAWRVTAAAHAVDVAPWLKALSIAPEAPKSLADWTRLANPRARIDRAALQWQQGGHYVLMARLSGLKAVPVDKLPGADLAQVVVRADDRALSVELPSQTATLALKDVFRQPFTLTGLAGTLVAWRADGAWNIGTDALRFGMGTLTGEVNAHIVEQGHGKPPFVKAYAAVQHARVVDAKRFLPYRRMPASLIAWLNHALVAGDVTSARVLMRGPLEAWPFPDHKGRFEATGVVNNATFNFSDEWPRATDVDAVADFVDDHMDIAASNVTMRQVTLNQATASIPDLGHGTLNLIASGKSSGASLLDFVRHSPVGKNALDTLAGMTIGGTGKYGIQLSIPLHDASKFTLHGKVELANADVTAKKWNLALKDLTGPLLIDGAGFTTNDLTAQFRGSPASLSLAVGSGASDPADIVEASMDTTASVQTLVQGYPNLSGLVAHASGAAPFHIGVRVVRGSSGAPATPILHVRSSLAGVALDFPAPLDKPANATLPLNLTLQLPPNGAPLSVSLGDVLQIRGRLADPAHDRPAAMAVVFGATPPTSVPASGLVAGGHAAHLDMSGWIQQALSGSAASGFPSLVAAHVSTDDAEVFGSHLGALKMDFSAGAQVDTVHFDGAVAVGSVQLPTSSLMTRGITANFKHLYWPAPPAPKSPASSSAPTPPTPPAPPLPPPVTSPVAPTAIPPLHVTIGDLRIGNEHLGATAFESMPTLAGMDVVKFDSRGKDFAIQAHGDWNGSAASSQSHFVTDITSQDFGSTLASFGLKGLLAGGHKTHIHIDGTWPGAPSSFSLGWMNGTLTIDVGEGRILAVKPGLGRLLGLLSLRELPSRLALHFGDVFKKGFGFDRVTAMFRFENGSAFTKNLLIKAPAAKITMRGRVGFRMRDYDLTVDVLPHLGGTLAVVGAVIGGPVGAAAGLVVQGLLGKGINKVAGSTYRVTGSWDKPKIETIDSESVPASAASAAPAATAPVPATTTIAMPASTVAPAAPATSVAIPAAGATSASPSVPNDLPASSKSAGRAG